MPLDRAFLEMLTTVVSLSRYVGQDGWGNDQYSPPEAIRTIMDPVARQFGAEDGQHRMEPEATTQLSLTTDALAIKPKDRITLPSGVTVQVTSTDDASDEFGTPLYQTVTAQTAQRG